MRLEMHTIEAKEDGVYDVYPDSVVKRAGRPDDPAFSPTGVVFITSNGNVVVTATEILLWQDGLWFPRIGSSGEDQFIPPNITAISSDGSIVTTTDSVYYWVDTGWRNSLAQYERENLTSAILATDDLPMIQRLYGENIDWARLYYDAQRKNYV